MLGALAKRVLSSSATAAAAAASAASAAPIIHPTSTAVAAAAAGARPRAAGMVGLATRRGLSTEATAAAAAGGSGDGAELPLDLEKPKPPRNSLVGMVVSDKMDKSIVVRVSRIKLFLPYMVRKRTFKKIMAHDEENACGIGDVVRIKPSRPLSKRKAFTLHEILRRDPKLSLDQQQQPPAAGAGAGAASS